MTPTNELRWVEREIVVKAKSDPFLLSVDDNGGLTAQPREYTSVIMVLQQKWLDDTRPPTHQEGEWRDVQTVKEINAKNSQPNH